MRAFIRSLIIVLSATAVVSAGQIRDGILYVNDKPFYPLGSWGSGHVEPEELVRLGMNTAFRGLGRTEESINDARAYVRRCQPHGVQFLPYLTYGGRGSDSRSAWTDEQVRLAATLGNEPNLLAWYIGDDIYLPHLEGLARVSTELRRLHPGVPTVADYWIEPSEELGTPFEEHVDISCQYDYPVPEKPLDQFQVFFTQQREWYGDPIWTWIQNFMWSRTGVDYNLGVEGPGVLPEPEQVRIMSWAAINSGVRGLLFFSHREIDAIPGMAAEIALICREVTLFGEHLAAGEATYGLATTDSCLNAAAFSYNGSTVISAALMRPDYYLWVDEAVVENVTITCPWTGDEQPSAWLVATPDVVECPVAPGTENGTVLVTVPHLEAAGSILLTTDDNTETRLRQSVAAICEDLKVMAVTAAAAQVQQRNQIAWHAGIGGTSRVVELTGPAVRAADAAAQALADGNAVETVRQWRRAQQLSRTVTTSVMNWAARIRSEIPAHYGRFLDHPYALHNIPGLFAAVRPDDPWHFILEWQITGPFPLEWSGDNINVGTPAGFTRVYPPEIETNPAAVFQSVDGPAGWRYVESTLSGLLDFKHHFQTTGDVVCYARTNIIAPRDMNVTLSLGSNDGAKVFVNGDEVFALSDGRKADPHMNEIPVHLNAGENTVLVKVMNLGGGWQLYLSANDPERVLRYSAN